MKGLAALQLHCRVKANCAHTLPKDLDLQKSLNDDLNKASGESFAPRGRDAAGKACQSVTRAMSVDDGQGFGRGDEGAGSAGIADDARHESRTWERSCGSGNPMNQSRGTGATYLRALLLPQRSVDGERQTYRLCGAK